MSTATWLRGRRARRDQRAQRAPRARRVLRARSSAGGVLTVALAAGLLASAAPAQASPARPGSRPGLTRGIPPRRSRPCRSI